MTIEIRRADVESAFGREVERYDVTPIDPELRLHSVTGGVFRVHADDETLVLKVIRHGVDDDPGGLWVSGAEPAHRNYWKREWLAYASGLLGDLPGELRAPRCALAAERPNAECWLWLEDVEGRPGTEWSPPDYASVAFDLGTTQGGYAAGTTDLPTHDWLSRNWLRGWVHANETNAAAIADDSLWERPDLAPMRELRDGAARFWHAREALLEIVEAAPQSLVHLDFWPFNLFAADDGTTVAIDWSQVGIGSVAQDLDQLTLDPIWMQVLPDADPRELESFVLPGYLAGLDAAGCEVNCEQILEWYAAAAAIHYGPLLGFQAINANDPTRVEAAERRHNRSFADIVRSKATAIERAIRLAADVLGW